MAPTVGPVPQPPAVVHIVAVHSEDGAEESIGVAAWVIVPPVVPAVVVRTKLTVTGVAELVVPLKLMPNSLTFIRREPLDEVTFRTTVADVVKVMPEAAATYWSATGSPTAVPVEWCSRCPTSK